MPPILRYTPHADWSPIVECVARGGMIAFPTDTVYGVAASIHCEGGLERLYRLKGRDRCKPLPVLVASKEATFSVACDLPASFEILIDSFWPGALTLIVQADPRLSRRITAGGTTVGVRMPDHPVALEVLRLCGGALAVTSANRSGKAEARDLNELLDSIGTDIDWIVDGGHCGNQPPSTVVDLSVEPLSVRRVGPISPSEIDAQLESYRHAQHDSSRKTDHA